MNTFETAAVISMVDHLTGPLREMSGRVAGHESAMSRHAERISRIGRDMTFAMTLPIVEVTRHVIEKAVEFSKIENTLQGTLEQRAKAVDKLTMSTQAYAAAQVAAAKAASEAAYNDDAGLPKALVNVKEHQEAILAAAKAGFTDMATNDPRASMVPAIAVADVASQLAMATRTDTHTAADDLIAVANALQVETRDGRGIALDSSALHDKFGHLADVITSMYTSSSFKDHAEIAESLKLAAPLARFSGLDIGQIAAMSAAQKEAGFVGEESSVAQRSFLSAILAPKSSAYAVLQQIGLNLHEYQKMGRTLTRQASKNRRTMPAIECRRRSSRLLSISSEAVAMMKSEISTCCKRRLSII